MGLFDKMLDVMKLNDDEEFYDEEFDEYEDEVPVKKSFGFLKTGTDDVDSGVSESTGRASKRSSSSKISPMRPRQKPANAMEVCVIKPQAFEDARDIAETLLASRTVILNMEGLDYALAQRLIDFISGACYAINGNLQRVSGYIFVVTPHAVDISGDLQDIADAFGFGSLQPSF
ncbi:MAG: cell division protein SepF [Lachnospiraceae bacterium]|nr:cell division protein SepF [Lachnospiraceae bacterium]